MKNKRDSLTPAFLSPHLIWCALFIVVPLLFVLYYTFTTKEGSFTFDNVIEMIKPESGYLRAFGVSILYALASTAICLLIAYPLALVISDMAPRKRQLMLLLVMLPMWVNFIIRTYTVLNIFETNGLINNLFKAIGLPTMEFTGTPGLVIFGMVYDFLPYMVTPICNVLSGIDKKYMEAASDLGCSPMQKFLHVLLPLSLSGIVSGITMVFVPAISTFYIASTLSIGTVTLIGDKIEMSFIGSNVNFNVGSALSLVLMLMILACMFIMNRVGGKQEDTLQ